MPDNFTVEDDNMTDTQHGGLSCGPPPGWKGPPPPGPYLNAADMLMKIVPPILIIFGTFGNTLTVVILIRQVGKLSSTAVFLLALAVSDTMFLFTGPLRRWIIAVWNKDIRHISEIGCKFSVYFTYSSIQFSSWILVAVTVERLISVVWPHRVKLGCTPRLSVMTVFILFLIIFGLNTHILYGFGRSDLPMYRGFGYCEALYPGYQLFWSKSYAWIDFCVVYALPFCILTASNMVIIYKLKKTRGIRRTMSVSERSSTNDTKSITLTLTLLSLLFFICLTPVSVYFIYRPYWAEDNEKWICVDVYEYIRLEEISKFVFVVTNLFGYINASFNFVLYIISGSKYRSEIKALFLCRTSGKSGVFGRSTSGSHRQTMYSTVSTVRQLIRTPQSSQSRDGRK